MHAFPTSPHIDAYITGGVQEDGTLGEIFIVHSGQGTFIRGLLDALAMSISIALQWGVPLESITSKMRRTRFGPFGKVLGAPVGMAEGNKPYVTTTSVADYIGAYLDYRFPKGKMRPETRETLGMVNPDDKS